MLNGKELEYVLQVIDETTSSAKRKSYKWDGMKSEYNEFNKSSERKKTGKRRLGGAFEGVKTIEMKIMNKESYETYESSESSESSEIVESSACEGESNE